MTVVVPGQKSEDDEGATIAASGIAALEPAAPESEAKATELPEPTGIAEAPRAVFCVPSYNRRPTRLMLNSCSINMGGRLRTVAAVPVVKKREIRRKVPGAPDWAVCVAASL